jgi:hypothetical protein
LCRRTSISSYPGNHEGSYLCENRVITRQAKYRPRLRRSAIRMVYERREDYESQLVEIKSAALKISCRVQMPRNWIAKVEFEAGGDDAASAPRLK